jgi:hypothetical protein
MRHGDLPPRLLSQNHYSQKVPIGIYDRNILCMDCEKLFGEWDDYAQKLLDIETMGATPIVENSQVAGYEVAQYQYDKLKLFFISLLWRASISTHRFYKRISLGQLEPVAKEFIEKRDPGTPEDFSVTIAKFDHPLGTTILDPHPQKNDHINYYRFYLGSYVAYIKSDKRKTPSPFASFMMTPNEPLRIIVRDLERSKELPLIQKIATADNNTLRSTRKK